MDHEDDRIPAASRRRLASEIDNIPSAAATDDDFDTAFEDALFGSDSDGDVPIQPRKKKRKKPKPKPKPKPRPVEKSLLDDLGDDDGEFIDPEIEAYVQRVEKDHKQGMSATEDESEQDAPAQRQFAGVGGMAAVVEEDDDVYYGRGEVEGYVSLKDTTWLQRAAQVEEQTADPHWCFLCTYSQSDDQWVDDDHFMRLHDLIDQNYGVVCNEQLSLMIQTYYNKELREQIIDESEQKVWRRSVIIDHLEKHRPTNIRMLQRDVRTLNAAMNVLEKNGMCTVGPDGMRVLNKTNTNMMLALMKMRLTMQTKADAIGVGASSVL